MCSRQRNLGYFKVQRLPPECFLIIVLAFLVNFDIVYSLILLGKPVLMAIFQQLQDIFQKLKLWKLVVSVFAFSSTPELMFGAYLLYYFRVFERQISSNKHSVSIFLFYNVQVLDKYLSFLLLAYLETGDDDLISRLFS